MIDGPVQAHENMARDEAVGLMVKQGKSPPTLRLYQWQGLSVTIGRYQKASEVDLTRCAELNIPVVRRPTGGRAILHGQDLTYSFSSQSVGEFFSGSLLQSYGHISQAFLIAFNALGIPAELKTRKEKGRVLVGSPLCFQSVSFGEITIKGKKVIGSAQRRWEDAFLQQGTIMLRVPAQLQAELFINTSVETITSSMCGLLEYADNISIEILQQAIAEAFEKYFKVSLKQQALSPEELALTEKLLQEKYLQDQYLHER